MNFTEFNFKPALQEGLDIMGFKNPTPIQEQAIPIILKGKDIIGCAQTGTGKTAAFVLPILNLLISEDHSEHKVKAVIIAPTRELAQQIDQQIEGFSYFTGVSSISIYGGGDGKAWVQQKNAIKSGVDLLVATPGRLISLLLSDEKALDEVKYLILDEADRMLDMGFSEDIDRIISYMPENRQTLLFSATMPPKIRKLAEKRMKNPEEITLALSKPAAGIEQKMFLTHDDQKIPLLIDLLKDGEFERIIIFAGTKDKVKSLGKELKILGLNLRTIHSDLNQAEREETMNLFKASRINVLVGTDIISRGIDVENVDLVVNFDVPDDPEDYVHRIGRTARASAEGKAFTFVNQKDQRKVVLIEQLIERALDKVVDHGEEIGKGPVFKQRTGQSKSFKSREKRNFTKKRNWKGKKGGKPNNSQKND